MAAPARAHISEIVPQSTTVDPTAIPWDTSNFPGCECVRIAFKRVGDRKNEHYMNRLSVIATREPNDVAPGGLMCHAELMLLVRENTWYRFSVNKMSQKIGKNGKTYWQKGTVHGKWVKPRSMDKYCLVDLHINRDRQHLMFTFLKNQLGKEFNTTAYWFNFVFPCFPLGYTRYRLNSIPQDKKWYCVELIVAAFQMANITEFAQLDARVQSPNSLYRHCSRLNGARNHGIPTSYA